MAAAVNSSLWRFSGDSVEECACSPSTITRYQKRISGPLLGRIDIHPEGLHIESEKLAGRHLGQPSAKVRERVCLARERPTRTAVQQLQLSARAYHRVLKLSRTVADLVSSDHIETAHLAEALQYRPRELV